MRRTVSPVLWSVVIALALALALWFAGRSTVSAIRQDERTKVLADGERLGRELAAAYERRAEAIATAHTDTVRERVVVTRWQVDTLIRQLPPEVREIPAVDTLVRVVTVLTVQVDSLDRALDRERIASKLRADVDSAAIVSLRIMTHEQERTIVRLQKRPTWAKVGGAFVVGALVGVAVGVLR